MIDTPLPDNTRHFFDPEKLRDWVKDAAKSAFSDQLNKIETSTHALKVKDLHFQDKPITLAEQKQAILEKRDVTLPLHGTVQLFDKKTGDMVKEKKTIIAHIPYVTERNTNILNGSEYVVINQQRLKPGVYTRVKETGEAEAHINVAPGSGLSGKVIFHPETAVFVYELGSTQIKLYGLLKALGVSDAEMEQTWGKEILSKNKRAYVGDELDKFYSRINQYR